MTMKLHIFMAVMVSLGCDSASGPGAYHHSSTLSESENNTANYIQDVDLKIGQVVGKRVDPKILGIFDLAIANREGNKMPLIEYSASGMSEYVEMEVCSSEAGDCKTSKLLYSNREVTPLSFGKHTVTLKACVSAKFSTKKKKGCGEPSDVEFNYPSTAWNKAKRLYEKKAGLEQALQAHAEDARKTLEESLKELEQCEKDLKKSQKAMLWKLGISGALALGDMLLDKAIMKGANPKKVPKKIIGVNESGDPISNLDMKKPVESFAHGTNGLGAAGPSITKLNEKLTETGFFKKQSVPALATIGGAVFDLFKAKDMVNVPCLAGEKYQNKMAAIEILVDNTNQELLLVNQEIIETLGELQ